MTTRQAFFVLLAVTFLGGCAAPKVMKPQTAALTDDASATRCVGEDVCFVYRKE